MRRESEGKRNEGKGIRERKGVRKEGARKGGGSGTEGTRKRAKGRT